MANTGSILLAIDSFLEELVNTKGINQFIAWLSYFLSIRAEENVSYSGFEHETEELMDVDWLHDYVILHLLPYKFTDIKDPGSPILVEELHPIIDRFETFVSMSLLYCVKYDDKQVLISALEQTENIGDHSLRQILMVLRDGYSVKDANVMQLVDTYTEGRYQETIASDCECLELMVRAYALAGQRPPLDEKPSLRQRAIALMHDIISLVPDAPQNRKNLKKIALISPSRSFSFQIAAFLERERNYIVSSGSSNLDLTAALSNSFYDPWISSALERICKDEMWLDQLLRAHPNSSTLKLRQAVTLKDEGMLEKELIPLPWYRKKMYLVVSHPETQG